MLRTKFTELLGCTVPIQQAGMGAISSPALAVAVANAGGLGMIGGNIEPTVIPKWLEEMRAKTSGVFGINFIVRGLERPQVEAVGNRARVVEFFYGDPDASLVELAHAGGALVSWQVGSVEEAVAAEAAGCDLIVAQGVEAGGHVRGKIGLLALLGGVVDAVHVPVVAAGGIGTGRAMAAALAAGASAVRVGTRFAAASESDAHPEYVKRLVAAEAKDTILTEAFSLNWPNAPHRVLRSCVEAAERFPQEVLGERTFADDPSLRQEVKRFQSLGVTKRTTGAIEAMSLWAGESVGGVREVKPAAEIIRELASEAERFLKDWNV